MRDVAEVDLLTAARRGDGAAFAELVEPHRRELGTHCYRMLGSPQDAEDAVQETLLAAWRGLDGFAGRSSLRTWLYRIATHACLRLRERRGARLLSVDVFAPCADPHDLGEPAPGPWIEPWVAVDTLGDPAAVHERREDVELAFVAALARLPGPQCAVLLLREVLQFSAGETAAMLDTTPAAVNSALQRARKGLGDGVPRAASGDDRALVHTFVAAWEAADLDGLVALLTEDARFTMPPLPAWFDGREAVAGFVRERLFASPWRLVPVRVNDRPGLACYLAEADGVPRLAAVNALGIRDGRIAEIAAFVDPVAVAATGLPETFSEELLAPR